MYLANMDKEAGAQTFPKYKITKKLSQFLAGHFF
jgi:hypothetical protein